MKKILFGLLALVVVGGLLAGCSSKTPDYTPPETSPPSANNTPADSTPVFDNPPPEDMTWISPGKVKVANFYPGARAEYPITVHNGNDVATSFKISYRYPDHVEEGHFKPPPEAQNWVIIADENPVLAPRETREILVILSMPEDAAVFAEEWEFWISIIDNSQVGIVKTELCTRWLVSMRSS